MHTTLSDSGDKLRGLQQTLGKMDVVLGQIDEAIVWTDMQGRVQWCNQPFDQLVGQRHIQNLGTLLIELLPLMEDGHQLPDQEHPVSLMLARPVDQRKIYHYQGDSQQTIVEIFSRRFSVSKTEESIVLVIRDITDQVAADKQLKETVARLETKGCKLAETSTHLRYLIDNSPAIIYSAVPTGDFKITFVSENLRNVLEYEPHEMLGDMNFWIEHIHPDDRLALVQRLPKLLSSGGQLTHNYRFRHRKGHYLWMHDTLRMVYDSTGQPQELLGSLLDITERKEMEETLQRERDEQRLLIQELSEARDQLLQNDKMAAIGQLAAGVAHEINNPIGYINSNLGTLKHYVEDLLELTELYQVSESSLDKKHPELTGHIQNIKDRIDLEYIKEDLPNLVRESQEGAERVRRIVQDLKEFSHVDEAEWQWADLHKGLDSTLNIVHNELKYKAEIQKAYGELPRVECIASQLNQVFMNLLVNAAHAIEKQGVISLRTGCDGDNVWIAIEDTGTGIPADKLTRIFEPFYTSKPVGVGTGLGLSLSYSIIKKHHGRIDVTSEVGRGSCFTIHLPVKHPGKTTQSEASNL